MNNKSRLLFSIFSWLWLIAVFLLFSFSFAYAKEFNQGLLFSIKKDGYPDSYLMGTIHSGDPRVLAMKSSIRHSLVNAEQFVMEIKFDSSVLMQSMTNLWLMDGRKLVDVIGENLYQQVVSLGQQLGMPEQTFSVMKPWVVMMMFSLPPGDYGQILDIELMKLAMRNGLEIRGLETVQEQFDVIDKMSVSDQVSLLKKTLKNYPLLTTQYEELFEAYLERNLQKLELISLQQMKDDGDGALDRLMYRMVTERNQKMLQRIMPMIAEKSSFIAVGALHLAGEHGLLNMLSQKGFELSMIQ